MRAIVAACGAMLCLSGTACSKKLDCGANAYVNEDPPFCVALPDGYTADKPQGAAPMMMSVHPKSSILGYVVYWNEKGSLKERSESVNRMGGGLSDLKLEDSGDIPSGKFWRFRTGSKTTFAVVLVEGKKGVIRCELQNRPDDAAGKELESCKSLRAN